MDLVNNNSTFAPHKCLHLQMTKRFIIKIISSFQFDDGIDELRINQRRHDVGASLHNDMDVVLQA